MNSLLLEAHMKAQTALLRLIAKMLIDRFYNNTSNVFLAQAREEVEQALTNADSLLNDTYSQGGANTNE